MGYDTKIQPPSGTSFNGTIGYTIDKDGVPMIVYPGAVKYSNDWVYSVYGVVDTTTSFPYNPAGATLHFVNIDGYPWDSNRGWSAGNYYSMQQAQGFKLYWGDIMYVEINTPYWRCTDRLTGNTETGEYNGMRMVAYRSVAGEPNETEGLLATDQNPQPISTFTVNPFEFFDVERIARSVQVTVPAGHYVDLIYTNLDGDRVATTVDSSTTLTNVWSGDSIEVYRETVAGYHTILTVNGTDNVDTDVTIARGTQQATLTVSYTKRTYAINITTESHCTAYTNKTGSYTSGNPSGYEYGYGDKVYGYVRFNPNQFVKPSGADWTYVGAISGDQVWQVGTYIVADTYTFDATPDYHAHTIAFSGTNASWSLNGDQAAWSYDTLTVDETNNTVTCTSPTGATRWTNTATKADNTYKYTYGDPDINISTQTILSDDVIVTATSTATINSYDVTVSVNSAYGTHHVGLSTSSTDPGTMLNQGSLTRTYDADTIVYAFVEVHEEYDPDSSWTEVSNGIYRVGSYTVKRDYNFGEQHAIRKTFTFTFSNPTYAAWTTTVGDSGNTKTVYYGDGLTVNTSTNVVTCYDYHGGSASTHSDTVRWQMKLPTHSPTGADADQWSYSKPVLNSSDISGITDIAWYTGPSRTIRATDGRTERNYNVTFTNGNYGAWNSTTTISAPYSATINISGQNIIINGTTRTYTLDNDPTGQYSYTNIISRSSETVGTGASVSSSDTQTENSYTLKISNPSSGYGSWSPNTLSTSLPYSTAVAITEGGRKVTVNGTVYTFTPKEDGAQYGYTTNYNYTQPTIVGTGKTIQPTVTRYTQQYKVTITAGTGIESVFLSTSPTATSGDPSGTKYNYDTIVYGYAKVLTGYNISGQTGVVSQSYKIAKSAQDFGTVNATLNSYTISFTNPAYGAWDSDSKVAYHGDSLIVSNQKVTCYINGTVGNIRWTNTVGAQAQEDQWDYTTPSINEASISTVTGVATFSATNSRNERSYTVSFSNGTYGSWNSTDSVTATYSTSIVIDGDAVVIGGTRRTYTRNSDTNQWDYSGSITRSNTIVGTGATVSSSDSRTEKKYYLYIYNPTSGYGSWDSTDALYLPYSTSVGIESGGSVVKVNGNTYTFSPQAASAQYGYTTTYSHTGTFTLGTGATIRPTVTQYTRSYPVYIAAGTGISSAFLSTSATASSGDASGTYYNYGTLVYGYVNIITGYNVSGFTGLLRYSYVVVDSDESFGTINATLNSYTISFTNPSYGSWDHSTRTAYHGDSLSVSGRTVTCYINGTVGNVRWTNSVGANSQTDQWDYTTPTINESSVSSVSGPVTFSASNSRNERYYNVTFTNGSYGTWSSTATISAPYSASISISGNQVTINGTTRTYNRYSTTDQWSYGGTITRSSTTVGTGASVSSSDTRSENYYEVTFSNGSYGSWNSTSAISAPYSASITVSGNQVTVNGTTRTYTRNSNTDQYTYSNTISRSATTVGTGATVISVDSRSENYYNVTFSNGSYGSWNSTATISAPYSASISVSGNTVTINGTTRTYTRYSNTDQYTYSNSISRSATTVGTGGWVSSSDSRSERYYMLYISNPTNGLGSWNTTAELSLPYSTTVTVENSGATIKVNGNTYTFTPPSTSAQYTYSTSYNYTSSFTLTTGKTVRPTVTQYTRSYPVTITGGTGISSVFLSTSDSATSGNASGTEYSYGTRVYGYIVITTGYNRSGATGTQRVDSVVVDGNKDFGSYSADLNSYTISFTNLGGSSWDSTSKTAYYGDSLVVSGQYVYCYINGTAGNTRWFNQASAQSGYNTPSISGGNVSFVSSNKEYYASATVMKKPVYFSAGTGISTMFTSSTLSTSTGSSSGTEYNVNSTVYLQFGMISGYKPPSGAAYNSYNGYYYLSATVGTSGYNFGTVSGMPKLSKPSCTYDYDAAADIKVTNSNSVTVNVYVDGASQGTIGANTYRWIAVSDFDEYYDIYFTADGYSDSDTVSATPGPGPVVTFYNNSGRTVSVGGTSLSNGSSMVYSSTGTVSITCSDSQSTSKYVSSSDAGKTFTITRTTGSTVVGTLTKSRTATTASGSYTCPSYATTGAPTNSNWGWTSDDPVEVTITGNGGPGGYYYVKAKLTGMRNIVQSADILFYNIYKLTIS